MKRKRRYKFLIIFLFVLLVIQIIAFSYLASPFISGFFVKETGRVIEDNSNATLKVQGTLNVKELCFVEGGVERCIKSANELKGEKVLPPELPVNIVEKEDCSGNSD